MLSIIRNMHSWLIVLALVAGCSSSSKKENDKKSNGDQENEALIGVWKVTKTEDPITKGATLEFTKGGKVHMVLTETVKADGTYSVDGKTISLVMKTASGKTVNDKMKITSLTATDLIIVDLNGETIEYKRVGAK